MRCISLWQSWASLVALDAKRIETRSWAAPDALIGQRIAIHAAKRWTHEEQIIACTQPFDYCLNAGGYDLRTVDRGLPFGAIVATARLVDCFYMAGVGTIPPVRDFEGKIEYKPGLRLVRVQGEPQALDISSQEAAFGNYAVGRFAWLLSDIEALSEPIPYRGSQGLFEVTL